MGFLKKFFRNVFRESSEGMGVVSPATNAPPGAFGRISAEDMDAHLAVARYGEFLLTDAIRPSYDLTVLPRQGFKRDKYNDPDGEASVPVLMASASREHLFDVFLDLLRPLGTDVDVVLETSHNTHNRGHRDLYREHIDMPVLSSTLLDYEDLLLNDGCTGIAVLNPAIPVEVQFDEHKLLIVYGEDLTEFEQIFANYDIELIEGMKFITEAEHVHSSSEEYQRGFEELRTRLGIDGRG